ncbi:MAG: aspartate aminotransferase family protein [Halanaerobiales bacterium]
MDKKEIMECNEKYFMNVFSGRYPLVADHGEGVKIYDKNGDAYIDFLAGIGVNALGYNHPELVKALKDQVEKIIHSSNLYYIEPQAYLEKLLIEKSCADKIFFANSGAEANEGALKLARKYFKVRGEEKYEVITAEKSFHGRSLATLAATGQKKYHKPFEPVPAGFKSVPFNDLTAVRNAINNKTAAIMVEPVQGEGGVYPAEKDYLKGLREICDENNLLLIFDEIQCGIGRTGSLFAYEQYGVEPDIFTLAKALGGGAPVGAFLAKAEVADSFEPGDHGSTFGGNQLATRAAYTTITTILEDNILDHVNNISEYFINGLKELVEELEQVKSYRGKGLMLALQLDDSISAAEVVNNMFEKGFLINAVQEHALRFLPPLIVEEEEIDSLIKNLKIVLADK